MIDTMIVLSGCSYLFYRSYKKKDKYPLYAAILVLFFQLSRWPFFMPILMSFSLQAFCAGGIVFYEYFIKRKDKMAIMFFVLFVSFGAVFAATTLFKG